MKIDTLYQPKLSASGKVTVAVCFAFLGNAAVAANIEAIGQTSVQQQHNVDIVNIAAPTAQGLLTTNTTSTTFPNTAPF